MSTNEKTTLKTILALAGVSMIAMSAAPAHAGPFDALKKAAAKEIKKEAHQRLAERADKGGLGGLVAGVAETATAGDPPTPRAGNPEKPGMSQNGTTVPSASNLNANQGQQAILIGLLLPAVQGARAHAVPVESLSLNYGKIRSAFNGGVRVASGDVNGDGVDDIIVSPGVCKMSQNGTTVETADEILANSGAMRAKRVQRALAQVDLASTCREMAKLVQNGTTVATADEILAPAGEETRVPLLIPAWIERRGGAVAPTDFLDASDRPKVALLLPAVQAAREAARTGKPQRASMSQNGTRVPSADTIQAPRDPKDPQEALTGNMRISEIPGE